MQNFQMIEDQVPFHKVLQKQKVPLWLQDGSCRGALCLDGFDFFELVDKVKKRLAINLELF